MTTGRRRPPGRWRCRTTRCTSGAPRCARRRPCWRAWRRRFHPTSGPARPAFASTSTASRSSPGAACSAASSAATPASLPAALAYREGSHGKPELDGAAGGSGIRFNVSNSGDFALYALTLRREIGVDLELIKPMPDGIDIARRFFSAPENEVFAGLGDEVRDLAFFRCWTRKEAYIKAVGEGLSMPLDRFDVAFAPGEPARILRTRGNPAEAERWTMLSLDPGPGYVGALAVEGGGWRPVLFDWDAAG